MKTENTVLSGAVQVAAGLYARPQMVRANRTCLNGDHAETCFKRHERGCDGFSMDYRT